MHELKKKRRIRRMIYSRTTVIFLLVLCAILVRGSWGVYQKERQSSEDIAKVEKELFEARTKEASLSKSLEGLTTERGKESEIRDRFNVTKPGEQVIFIIDEEEDETAILKGDKGLWNSIKVFFSGIFE